jgi:hypothetical protein
MVSVSFTYPRVIQNIQDYQPPCIPLHMVSRASLLNEAADWVTASHLPPQPNDISIPLERSSTLILDAQTHKGWTFIDCQTRTEKSETSLKRILGRLDSKLAGYRTTYSLLHYFKKQRIISHKVPYFKSDRLTRQLNVSCLVRRQLALWKTVGSTCGLCSFTGHGISEHSLVLTVCAARICPPWISAGIDWLPHSD